ncbi:MAG: Ig-like domain-containing protein [Desulfuromonadales bacterium]|nr:Ig-like domain-containing protein [Desulfuromonadales bacterium]
MKFKFSLAIIAVLILGYIPTNMANAAVTQFASLTYPKGVVVDQQGNVYVQSLSILGDGGLYKFSPDGTLLARNPNLFGKIRFVVDTVNNVIWALETKGMLYAINPSTLQAQQFVNLKSLSIPQGAVLNLLTGQSVDLLMIDPQYGDIALRRIDDSRFDMFITGQTSAGGIPFVIRLRFRPTLVADIVVASFPLPNPIIPPPLDTQASGIAVNADGKVLTALPRNVSGGISPFFLATFNADFPETNVGRPSFVSAFSNRQVYTMGMTDSVSDKGYYIVATAQGFGCGLGQSVLHVSESLDNFTCVADLSSLGLGNMTPDDVAVGPDNSCLYVTMSANNLVLRIDLFSQTAPTVTTTTPASSATGVALNSIITASFSKAMNASTLTSSTFTLNNGVTGNVNYNASTNTATFTPSAILSANTTYTATISTGVKDTTGTPLAANKTWSFTTTAGVPPTVTSTVPTNTATTVALNSILTATFSKVMNSSTINTNTFTLNNGVTGIVTYNASTNTASFTPSANLSASTTYTATISTGVKDTTGIPLAANKTWSFTTTPGGTTTNLLVNGDFEGGATGWGKSSSGGYFIINNNNNLSHGGSGFALLGGYDSGTDSLYQDITIPSDASTVNARFWYDIVTEETTTSAAYDTMQLVIKNPSTGAVLQTLTSLNNLNATGTSWAQSSQFDLSSYKGQTIRLQFTTSTDNSNVTFFLVDDVSLYATLPLKHTLTIIFPGNGKGTVTSNIGFACGINDILQIAEGTPLFLSAAENEFSDFTGWSGDCNTISGNTCNLTMATDKTVNATFTLDMAHRARIGTSSYFPTLQDAYNSPLSTGKNILAWATGFIESLNCNNQKDVTIDGGYNDVYSGKSGFSILQGVLTVGTGSLTVENLVIK